MTRRDNDQSAFEPIKTKASKSSDRNHSPGVWLKKKADRRRLKRAHKLGRRGRP